MALFYRMSKKALIKIMLDYEERGEIALRELSPVQYVRLIYTVAFPRGWERYYKD